MNASLKGFIETHRFFRKMRPDHLNIVARGATEVTFQPGQVLFREGDPANQFYLIESGSVALEAHEPGNVNAPVQTLRAGDMLGWSWLFPPFTWHLQARALEPTRAIALSGAALLTAAEEDHNFGYELMKRVAQVLIRRLQAARKQLVAHEMLSALES